MSVVRELLVKLGFKADVSGAKAFEAQTKQTTAAVQAGAKAAVVSGKATESVGNASAMAASAKGKDAAATKQVTAATVNQAKANKEVGLTAAAATEGLDKMTGGLLSGVVAAVSAKKAFDLLAGSIVDTIAKGNKVFAESARLNVYGENLQRVQAISDRTGVSLGTLDNGLRAIRGSMFQAAMGNSYAAAGFAGLGVKLTDAKGRLKSTTEAMADAATALSKMEPGWRKNWLATQVFGSSASELMPVLNRGGDALRGFMRDSEAFGSNLDENQVKASVKAADGLARLGQRAEGLKTVFGAALLPEVNKLLDGLNKLADSRGPHWIADMKIYAEGLAKALNAVAWAAGKVYDAIEPVVRLSIATSPLGLFLRSAAESDLQAIRSAPVASTYAGKPAAGVASGEALGLPAAGASRGVSAASTAAYAGALKAAQTINNSSATTINVGGISVTVDSRNAEDARALGDRIAAQAALTLQDKLNTRANTYRPVANTRSE